MMKEMIRKTVRAGFPLCSHFFPPAFQRCRKCSKITSRFPHSLERIYILVLSAGVGFGCYTVLDVNQHAAASTRGDVLPLRYCLDGPDVRRDNPHTPSPPFTMYYSLLVGVEAKLTDSDGGGRRGT